jgi:hypothetical protein
MSVNIDYNQLTANEPEGAALPGLRSEATREGDATKRPQVSEQ